MPVIPIAIGVWASRKWIFRKLPYRVKRKITRKVRRRKRHRR